MPEVGNGGDIKLSGIVVAYNEARFLPECLKRLSFCDELIVVDLGSQDNSVAIAESYASKILHHERVQFAEKVHQFALEHAQHDWVVLADPDLYFPSGIGPRLRELIAACSGFEIGIIYLPLLTCFGGIPLVYGQKGGVRSYRGVINRKRVEVLDYLHHRGITLKGNSYSVGLLREGDEAVTHYWVDSIRDALPKARRYLPYEGESRHAAGISFSWVGMFQELLNSLKSDLRQSAFRDWRAFQVMVFQLWYLLNANLSWHQYEIHLARSRGEY